MQFGRDGTDASIILVVPRNNYCAETTTVLKVLLAIAEIVPVTRGDNV